MSGSNDRSVADLEAAADEDVDVDDGIATAEADAKVSGDEDDDGEDDGTGKRRRRKYAVWVAYVGAGYHVRFLGAREAPGPRGWPPRLCDGLRP